MSVEPPRLSGNPDVPEDLRRALEGARGSALTPEASLRVRTGVEHRLQEGVSAGATSTLAKIGIAVVVAGAVVAALTWPRDPTPATSRERPPPAVTEPAPVVVSEPEPEPEPTTPEPATPETSTVEPEPEPRVRRAAKRPQPGADRAAEARILLGARRALRTDPAGALAASEKHRRIFPRGELAEERELLAVRALVALHRRDEARKRAAAFARSYPDSPYEGAVRDALTQRGGD